MTSSADVSLPPGWSLAALGEVLSVLRGVTYKGEESQSAAIEGYVPILRATNINQVLDFDNLVYVPEKYVRQEQFLQKGDLVIAASSGSKSVVGKAARMTVDWNGSFGAFCYALRVSTEIDSSYIAYFLQTKEYRNRVSELASGININNLRRNHIEEAPVRVPPFAEQRRIVAAIEQQLTRLDAAVASLQRARANLARYRAAVLQAAVSGKLISHGAQLTGRDTDTNSPPEPVREVAKSVSSSINPKKRAGRLWGSGTVPQLTADERNSLPDGWEWVQARELGHDQDETVQVGPMSMRSKDFDGHGVPVLNVGCVQWGRFDETKLNHLPEQVAAQFDRYRIEPGDVLFTRSGTVGRAAVAGEHQRGWLMTFHLLRVRTDPQTCRPHFLRVVLEGAPHIRRQTREASIGTTRAGFNTNLLANLDVPLPPLDEQRLIIDEVDRRLSVIDDVKSGIDHSLKRAERLRQAILKRAFAGELVPQEPGDEPASVLLERIRAERAGGQATPKRTRQRPTRKPKQTGQSSLF